MVQAAPSGTGKKMLEQYKLLKQLGDGQFGTAYLATDTVSGKNVCVKVFKELDKATQKTFEAEVQAGTSGLVHPNVIKLQAAGRSAIKVNGEAQHDVFYIAMELCANGEAFDYVEAASGLSDKYARQIFTQLIEGVSYIHKKNIAHRDLKLENCFLDKNCVLKVADFGLQKAFAGPKGHQLRTRCGTPNYMAPELLTGKDAYNGPAVDIFACGAILFILRFAKFAFAQANDKYYRCLHRDPLRAMSDRRLKADPKFLDLVIGMTKQDPKQRLTLDQVKAHPWMQGETSSAMDVRNHYYSLVPGIKCVDKEHYAAMQAARKAWASVPRLERGHKQLGYDSKNLSDWVKDSSLFNLEYKEFDGFPSHTGFFSKTSGQHLLLALYEHFALQGLDANSMLEVDGENYKVTFTLEEEMDQLPADEEEPEEEDAPIMECDVSASVRMVEANPDQPTIPKLVYMNFKCKNGNRVLFGSFLNKIMKDMEKFMEPFEVKDEE